jgi:hypothetical protein
VRRMATGFRTGERGHALLVWWAYHEADYSACGLPGCATSVESLELQAYPTYVAHCQIICARALTGVLGNTTAGPLNPRA